MRGKGYRLPPELELLEQQRITSHLSAEARERVALNLKLSTSSTNDAVHEDYGHGKPIKVCIAEHQSAGRGRRGRNWVNPFGSSLYYSMLCSHKGGFAALEGLSLAVGLTILQTLEEMGVPGLGLKWPNDLVANGCKLAGVLLEVSGDPTGECEIIIGIGVNLVLSPEQKALIDQPVIDVHTLLGHPINKNELAGRLTTRLVAMLEAFQRSGFRAFREQWQKYDVFAGLEVALLAGDFRVLLGLRRA